MSFQETAIAIGLLTPLILGVLAFVEKFIHKKKEPDKEEEPKVVQGMTVPMDTNPYADQLIGELRREIGELNGTIEILRDRLERKE
jgi:hypothetical protein